MNKIIISIGVLVIAIFGWLAFQENTVYYVATIDNEVTELEDELVKIDAEVQAGTLSPEAATVARVSIVTRLEKINTAVAESKSKELTPEQQKMLVDGLNRLKEILVKYKTTLTVVEDTATIKTDITSSNGRRHTSITAVLNETIDTVEENVIDEVEDYSPEDSETADENEDTEQSNENTVTIEEEGTQTDETTNEESDSEEVSPINIIDPSLGITNENEAEATGDTAIETEAEASTTAN